jgi:hypothetical protein
MEKIRVEMEGKPMYQELTDSKLSFGSLPSKIYNSQALVIPSDVEEVVGMDLIHIPKVRLNENTLDRTVTVEIDGSKMNLTTKLTAVGEPASDYRWYLSDLSKIETKELIDDYSGGYFESDFKVHEYSMVNLDNLEKEFALEIDMTLEDEVKSIGSLKTFTVPFFEMIAMIDDFPDEERNHAFNYWEYEDIDQYNTSIEITIAESQEFVEIPEGVRINNEFMQFEITIERIAPNKLKISRLVRPITETLPSEKYEAFRECMKQVAKAEETYVAFKEK